MRCHLCGVTIPNPTEKSCCYIHVYPSQTVQTALCLFFWRGRGGETDFPGDPVVSNLPSNERHVCFIPDQGTKIPHAAGPQSLCTVTTQRALSRARAPQLETLTPQ